MEVLEKGSILCIFPKSINTKIRNELFKIIQLYIFLLKTKQYLKASEMDTKKSGSPKF